MRGLKLCLLSLPLLLGCGGGAGSSEDFNSIAGLWEIDAQDIIKVNCPHRVGGFTNSIDVHVDGSSVTASGPRGCEAGPAIHFSGHLTNDGFMIEGIPPEPCSGSQIAYRITVMGMSTETNDRGIAEYSYTANSEDGSILCTFTASGTAVHISG